MAQQLYRVVESAVVAGKRVDVPIGCSWKPLREARKEFDALKARDSRTLGLQKQTKEHAAA